MKQRRPPHAQRLTPDAASSNPWPLVAVVAAFVLSRVGYYLAGVRFDASSLSWFWQYVDPALLRANLWQSLWYLHSQPPAFNLFLGLVLDLLPGHEAAAFASCYLLLGLIFVVTLFLLLREHGVSDVLSAVVAAAYIASPACVLYENWLFYTYPLTVLLLLAALFWHRFSSRSRFLDAQLLFIAASLLALTWSFFHLAWLILLVIIVILLRRNDWRKVLAAAAVPVLVVTLWYGKNLVLFGQFTGSTWSGINFSKMTNSMLTVPERKALYDAGTISGVSLVPPFSSLDKYANAAVKSQPAGVPALDQEMKPSGIPNFNNKAYIAISERYGRDAFRILAARPSAYLRGLAESFLLYFLPTSSYLFLAGNAEHVRALDRLVSIVFNGRFFHHSDRSLRQTAPVEYYLQSLLNTGWFVIIAYALVLILGFFILLFRSRSSLLFLWLTIACVTFVANAVEVGENNRFRFIVDPLVVVFLACLANDWLARRRAAVNDR